MQNHMNNMNSSEEEKKSAEWTKNITQNTADELHEDIMNKDAQEILAICRDRVNHNDENLPFEERQRKTEQFFTIFEKALDDKEKFSDEEIKAFLWLVAKKYPHRVAKALISLENKRGDALVKYKEERSQEAWKTISFLAEKFNDLYTPTLETLTPSGYKKITINNITIIFSVPGQASIKIEGESKYQNFIGVIATSEIMNKIDELEIISKDKNSLENSDLKKDEVPNTKEALDAYLGDDEEMKEFLRKKKWGGTGLTESMKDELKPKSKE